MHTQQINTRKKLKLALMAMMVLATTPVLAQAGGQAGLTNAASQITDYFPLVKNIIMAIGGVVGLIGGIRIYNKWTNGDRDINKEIVGWGGACLFLVIVPTFVGSFFGL